MPAKTKVPPAELMALVLEFLSSSGMNKTAKKLKSEFDEELPGIEGKSLTKMYELYQEHVQDRDAKKRKKEKELVVDEEHSRKKKRKQKHSTPEDSEIDNDKHEKSNEESESKEPASKKGKNKGKAESIDEPEPRAASGTADSSSTENDNQGSKSSTPFKRIKEEDVTYMKVRGGHNEATRLKDNTFESKNGDAYGAKAAGILGQVRGRDFRHEKTKKKRSYRSPGAIDLSSNSIKFEDSDDE